MIDFKEAAAIATENAKSLVPEASNFKLEGAVLSGDDKLYEITLSYDLGGRSPLELQNTKSYKKASTSMAQLASLLSYRREYKVFLVDRSNGRFKGFKNYKDG